ncbi:TonB-dependent receptor [Altererythrobacter arenosus]|uniref:TonB-dependent receptor n=1 Tax=Altererythrobacter arenosus TaxID=3032592 RepID=A0ABY8FMN8_9SPHN|nr:TonB-dependent receptor [Altererythrobacter sp. CAU 1644]WFL76290.1 TonB-dependent receptor [Altererythrobacter sp. CAU 1644]
MRLAMQTETRDGYATLIRPDDSTQDTDDAQNIAARLTVALDIAPAATLTVMGDYYRADDRANAYYYASAGYGEGDPSWYMTREGIQTLPYFAIKNAGRVTERKSRELYADVPYYNDVEVWGITGQLDWDLGGFGLQLLSSYRETKTDSQNEFDLSDSFNTYVGRAEGHWQFTADVQLSSPIGDAVSWIAGASYFSEDNLIDNDVFGDFWEPILIQGLTDLQNANVLPPFPIVIPQTTACCELQLSGAQDTEAFAVFAEADIELSERLTARVGGRYSWEQRDGAQRFELLVLPGIRFAPEVLFFPNSVTDDRNAAQPDPFGFLVAPVRGPSTFEAFTPKLGFDFEASDDVLLYATVQRGFKSGGYNIGSSQQDPFDPEKIWSYELGVKGELADGAVGLNSAIFYYDYTNLQAQDSVANQPIIRNVGKARVLGFEFESYAKVSDTLRLEANATRLDATFTDGELTEPLVPAALTEAPGSVLRDLDGLRLPRAPKWKFGGAVQWNGDVSNGGNLVARLAYNWQSKIYFTIFNIEAASEPSYGLLDARLAYTGASGWWSVTAFGKNLTNETYFTNQILTGTVYGAEFVGPLGPPRTYGIEVSVRF